MAAIDISNGGLQTGPDAADNHVNRVGIWNPNNAGSIEILIQVISAAVGIKFGVVQSSTDPMPADAYAAPAGTKMVITINNNQFLRFQCGNAADSFILSA